MASILCFSGVRFMIGAALVWLAGLALNHRPLPMPCGKTLASACGLGLWQTAAQYIFYYSAVALLTGAMGGILNSTQSFMGVILAHFLYGNKDRLTPRKALGCALGFGGVLVATLGNHGGGSVKGMVFMLIASVIFAPDMIRNISSCKSPQQMFGSLVKTYYAEQAGIDPQDIFVVSIMPCTAKKYEVLREEQRLPNGCMPVDVSLTTRELGRMITQAGLLFEHLPDGAFDPMLGVSTGAAAIFGASGGVMEAALRTVVEQLTGAGMAPLEYQEVRGMEGVKEASYELPGKTVRVCVASGLHNVKRVLDGIRDGSLQYDFVEFMACPGGCINGGGQPIQHANVRNFTDIKALRAAALYKQDEGMTYRRSHENPVVQKVYADFLGEPGGHKAHALLHCSYIKQKRYRV